VDKAERSVMRTGQYSISARLVAVFVLLFSWMPAKAAIQIDINRGNLNPLPIAVPAFIGNGAEEKRIGLNMAGVITNNLERSGLFKPLSPNSFISTPTSLQVNPRFPEWRKIGAQALVTGATTLLNDGRLKVEFRLWDVLSGTSMVGVAYFATPGSWRRIAHVISDAIYKRLTGEEGYFDTRVVYVSEDGPKNRRIKRLAIMDQDGAGHRYLTDGSYLVLTPRFSPSRQEITYLSYFNNSPRVYLFNIDSGRQELLGDFPGMTYAPRFSPDGNKVVMSLAQSGRSDIYVMDLRTRRTQRLTNSRSIDTSPSYSPKADRIVFNSDRGGSQQLYVMSVSGSGVKRISFGKGRYATPVWSPRGDLIAFTKYNKGRFHIGVMRPDGSGERLLTESFLDEGPTWAPNGRVLMFFRQRPTKSDGSGGSVKLWSIDLTGYNERQVITPIEASDPAWSPLTPLSE